jgi:hypothetical protein
MQFLSFLFGQRLNRHETHRVARGGFANGLGIVAIILVAFDEGFDELRIDEPGRVAQPRDLAGPMMGAAASLHRDHAARQISDERQQLRAAQTFAQDLPPTRISAVQMEDALGQIDTQNCEFHGGPSVSGLLSSHLTQVITTSLAGSIPSQTHPNPAHPNRTALRANTPISKPLPRRRPGSPCRWLIYARIVRCARP